MSAKIAFNRESGILAMNNLSNKRRAGIHPKVSISDLVSPHVICHTLSLDSSELFVKNWKAAKCSMTYRSKNSLKIASSSQNILPWSMWLKREHGKL